MGAHPLYRTKSLTDELELEAWILGNTYCNGLPIFHSNRAYKRTPSKYEKYMRTLNNATMAKTKRTDNTRRAPNGGTVALEW